MGPLDIPDISGTRHGRNLKLGWLDLLAYKKLLRDLLFRMAFDAFPAESQMHALSFFRKRPALTSFGARRLKEGAGLCASCQIR